MKSTAVRNNKRAILFPLWAGLLILGSLAPPFAAASEHTDELSVRVHDGLVSLTARNTSVQDVIEEIAIQAGLRIVQHAALDGTVNLHFRGRPLPDVLGEILSNDSYQLFQRITSGDEDENTNPVPGTLWIFSEGSSLAPAATIFFEAVLIHGNYREKKEAIRDLQRLSTRDAVQTLSLALGDEDSRVRNAALEALAKIGSDEALAAIASASIDADPWVRSEAALAFSSSDAESAAQYLNLAMADPDPRVRMAVIDAFGDIPSDQAIAALSLALRDEDPKVRMHAADALEEMGDEIAFQAVMQARKDEIPQ